MYSIVLKFYTIYYHYLATPLAFYQRFQKINPHYYYFDTLSKIKPILQGKDILSTGIPAGKHCSAILKDIFFYQLDNNINSKNELKDYLSTIKDKYITDY